MAKKKTRRSRFDGIDLTTLNQEAAKVTGQKTSEPPKPKEEKKTEPEVKSRSVKSTIEVSKKEEVKEVVVKRGKGRPKTSKRKPLNTAIEPKNRQRLEFLAMLNGGSVADQLNDILEHYFTNVEKVDELIEVFEKRKNKSN
jgi:2,3-bisphosphoglycerate-independent phosphoglycerate mutase